MPDKWVMSFLHGTAFYAGREGACISARLGLKPHLHHLPTALIGAQYLITSGLRYSFYKKGEQLHKYQTIVENWAKWDRLALFNIAWQALGTWSSIIIFPSPTTQFESFCASHSRTTEGNFYRQHLSMALIQGNVSQTQSAEPRM